jgi:hypothetical protein
MMGTLNDFKAVMGLVRRSVGTCVGSNLPLSGAWHGRLAQGKQMGKITWRWVDISYGTAGEVTSRASVLARNALSHSWC